MNALEWAPIVAPVEPAGERDTLLHRLANLDDWLTMAAGLLAVIAVAGSIQAGQWVESMPSLWLVATLGLLAGFVAARLPAPTAIRRLWTAIGGALLAGAVVVIPVTMSAIESGGPWARWTAFHDRMGAWFDVVVNGGISDDPVPFILLVVSVSWLVGYGVAWSLFSLRNAWPALVPLAVIVIFNNAYRRIEFDWAFALFLFAALLLIGRAALQRQVAGWVRDGVDFPEFVGLRSFWHTLWIVSALWLVAWFIPADIGGQAFGGLWDRVVRPLDDRLFESGRFFAAVKGQSGTPFREFGQTLPLGGAIDLRDRVQMQVDLSEPVPFLRVAAYQQYDRNGWLNTDLRGEAVPPSSVPSPADVVQGKDTGTDRGGRIGADIEARRKLDRLAVPGIPLSTDRSVTLQATKPATYALPLTRGEQAPAGTPKELLDVLPRLQRGTPTSGQASGPALQRFGNTLPLGYQARSIEGNPPMLIVERVPPLSDALSLDAARTLNKGDHYRVLSLATNASEADLRAAGMGYPPDVLPFLQLPDRFPTSVTELAQKLAADQSTPYDKAVAVEVYLRTIPYDESIPRPQPGVDRVERFLFGLRRGYFDYHASAMTVMLRALGIPARMATGYALQERGEDGRYVVRETNTYSWPEVYFPGIGWVAFNPTPNLPPVERPGNAAANAPAAVTPQDQLGGIDPGLEDPDLFGLSGPSAAAPADAGHPWVRWTLIAMLAGFAVGALGTRLYWDRGLGGLPYPVKLWEKTLRLAAAAGAGPRPEQTPREFARDLGTKVGRAGAVERLARAYEGVRFGAKEPGTTERESLGRDYRALRNRLFARLTRWRAGREEDDDA